jgi:hypothetical protein
MFGSLKLIGVFTIVIGMMAGGFYWYYKTSQETIATLSANVAVLKSATEMQEQTITSLRNDHALANQVLSRLNSELSDSRAQNRLLVDRLAEHDLGYLAESRPGLVERIINRASDRAGRCFEIITGSPLTDRELAATSDNEFNSECPWLWPGRQ